MAFIEQNRNTARLVVTETHSQITHSFFDRGLEAPEDVYNAMGTPGYAVHGLPIVGDQHPSFAGLFARSIDLRRESGKGVVCDVLYRTDNYQKTTLGEIWDWDLNATQVRITAVKNSADQVHYPHTSDVGPIIGWDGEDVQGVDVFRPSGSLRVIKEFTSIDSEGIQFLHASQARTNDDFWFGYAPGQVLYLGTRVSQTPEGRIRLEYNFIVRQYAQPEDISLIDGSVVTAHPAPFQHLWFKYGEKLVAEEKQRGIESAHIATVYPELDFELLELTGPIG